MPASRRALLSAAVLGTLPQLGCSAMQIDEFTGSEPRLVLEQYFQGRTRGWGVVQDRFGTLRRQFQVEAEGVWDEATSTLSLVETYRFSDGFVDVLRWTIRRQADGRYVGDEPHLVGAAEGRQAGNAFHWTYVRDVPQPDGSQKLTFDDWFWLQPDEVLISRASMRKLGIEVATLSLFYRKA